MASRQTISVASHMEAANLCWLGMLLPCKRPTRRTYSKALDLQVKFTVGLEISKELSPFGFKEFEKRAWNTEWQGRRFTKLWAQREDLEFLRLKLRRNIQTIKGLATPDRQEQQHSTSSPFPIGIAGAWPGPPKSPPKLTNATGKPLPEWKTKQYFRALSQQEQDELREWTELEDTAGSGPGTGLKISSSFCWPTYQITLKTLLPSTTAPNPPQCQDERVNSIQRKVSKNSTQRDRRQKAYNILESGSFKERVDLWYMLGDKGEDNVTPRDLPPTTDEIVKPTTATAKHHVELTTSILEDAVQGSQCDENGSACLPRRVKPPMSSAHAADVVLASSWDASHEIEPYQFQIDGNDFTNINTSWIKE
ncbi:hypothetical protein DL95DRAFT_452786 [Leptodontidium sp. 2 PMI_412]|nr:hypothetical protein DL95DRAFT_452786 [Leptodontidium sp. 2 PMI_412]